MRYAIGIDIGATKIKGVLADNAGKILYCLEIPTGAGRNKSLILNDIVKFVDCLKGEAEFRHFKIESVGIGIPGTIKKGEIFFGGGTLKQLVGLDFKKIIQKRIGCKAVLENDSVVFAFAESYFGAGKKYKRVAGVIWGTGIGSGFINKNNRQRLSVEMGHFVVNPDIKSEPKDACGARGCAENLASGKNIIRRYDAGGGKIKNAGIKEIYLSKEKVAKEVLEDAYKYLGMGISSLIKITKPEIVVIGGGVSNLPKPAHDKVKKYIYDFLPKRGKSLKIEKSKIGKFAGALGAAMLVLAR